MSAPTAPPVLDEPAAVVAALENEQLVPPPPPPTLGSGATLRLRSAMARFSGGDDHLDRRRAVEAAVGAVDLTTLAEVAGQRTRIRLDRDERDACRFSTAVPVESVAVCLGVADADLEATVADTEAIVRAIGRGEVATESTDAAVERLLARASGAAVDPVAAVSLLYQAHDATAALFIDSLIAAHRDGDRPSALPGTVRVAREATRAGDHELAAGSVVALRFTGREMEFGAGHHRCPGIELARTIVAAMIDAIAAHGLMVADSGAGVGPEARPAELNLGPGTR